MFRWLRTRRWRRSVEEAISSGHFDEERARLVADVGSRAMALLVAHPSAGTAHESMAARVASAVERQLDRHLVQASLGLRYMLLMQDRLRHADYEDVPVLQAEVSWLTAYLLGRLRFGPVRGGAERAFAQRELPTLDALHEVVAGRALAALHATVVAA